jgi:hypothetical protein
MDTLTTTAQWPEILRHFNRQKSLLANNGSGKKILF